MKLTQPKFELKFCAALVAGTFLLQQIAFAAPALTAFTISNAQPYEMGFSIPESLATIDDSFDAGSGRPLIYLFQDAHTNDSGQINTAHTLDLILRNEDIKTVFSEAAQGANSLSHLKQYASDKKRHEVGLNYLRKGLLNGVEYLSLTGATDFEIWGVEDKSLYQESIQVWGEIAEQRSVILEKLYEIQRGIDLVKREIFDEDLLRFDRAVWNFKNEKTGITDHLDLLSEFAALTDINLKKYKEIKQLKSIRKQESKINFEKANDEQMQFISSLPVVERKELIESYRSEGHHPFKFKSGEHQSSKAFFVLLKERVELNFATSKKEVSKTYPELDKYFRYMEMTQEADIEQILNEIHEAEQAIYQKLSQDADQSLAVQFAVNIDYLSRLFEFKLTPQEFSAYKNDRRSFHPLVIAGFVNRKIAEFKKNYEQVVILDAGLDDLIRKAESFYALTYQRDLTFIAQMEDRLSKSANQKAVLITGGYHAPNLKALLERKRYSYVSVLPQVLHETDFNRYETLLLSQTQSPESSSKRVASTSHDLKLSSRAAMVRLLRSGLFTPREGWALASFLTALELDSQVVDREVQAMVAKFQGGEIDSISGDGEIGGRPETEVLDVTTNQQTTFLIQTAQEGNWSAVQKAVEAYPIVAAKLSNDIPALNQLNDSSRGQFLAAVFQLQASRLSPFIMLAVLTLSALLPNLPGVQQQVIADQIRVVLDESTKPVSTQFEYRSTIEERYRPIERKDLLGFNYQATQGFKGAQDYVDEGKVHEMLAPLLPKDSPLLKKYGLESLGQNHADLMTAKLGGKSIRVYYLPTPDGSGTAKDRLIQADYERTNAILNEVYKTHGIRVTLNHWMGLHAMPGSPKLTKNNAAEREAVFRSVERTAELYGKEPWLLVWQLGNEPNYHIKNGKLTNLATYPFETYQELIQFHAEAAIRLKAAERKLGENYRHPVFIGNGSLNELEAAAWSDLLKEAKYDVAVDGLSVNAYPGIDWIRGTADLTQVRREMALIASLASNVVNKPVVIGEIGFWASKDIEQRDKQREYLDAVRDGFRDLPTLGGLQIFSAVDEGWKSIQDAREGRFGVFFTENGATRLKDWKGFDASWYQAAEGAGEGFDLIAEIPVGYDIENQKVTVYGQAPTDSWAGNYSKFEHDLTKLDPKGRIFFKIQPNVNKARKLVVKLEGLQNSQPNQFFVEIELVDGNWVVTKANEGVDLKLIEIGKTERGYLKVSIPNAVVQKILDRTSVAHVLHGKQTSISATNQKTGKVEIIQLELNANNTGNIRGAAVGIEAPKAQESKKSGARLTQAVDGQAVPLAELLASRPVVQRITPATVLRFMDAIIDHTDVGPQTEYLIVTKPEARFSESVWTNGVTADGKIIAEANPAFSSLVAANARVARVSVQKWSVFTQEESGLQNTQLIDALSNLHTFNTQKVEVESRDGIKTVDIDEAFQLSFEDTPYFFTYQSISAETAEGEYIVTYQISNDVDVTARGEIQLVFQESASKEFLRLTGFEVLQLNGFSSPALQASLMQYFLLANQASAFRISKKSDDSGSRLAQQFTDEQWAEISADARYEELNDAYPDVFRKSAVNELIALFGLTATYDAYTSLKSRSQSHFGAFLDRIIKDEERSEGPIRFNRIQRGYRYLETYLEELELPNNQDAATLISQAFAASPNGWREVIQRLGTYPDEAGEGAYNLLRRTREGLGNYNFFIQFQGMESGFLSWFRPYSQGSRLSISSDPVGPLKHYVPRQAVLDDDPSIYEGSRTNEDVQKLLQEAKRNGQKVIISMPLRGVDGSGSANDLPEWQIKLTPSGDYAVRSLPTTPTLAAGEVEFEIEALEDDENAVVYVAPHIRYADGLRVDESNPYRVEGPIQLEANEAPNKQLDAAAYIFINLFEITGVKIRVNKISPLASLGGFESSNAVNIALLSFASSLKGADWSLADIRAKAIELENSVFGGYTGGQGHNAVIEGGAKENIWPAGIRDSKGRFTHAGEALVRDLVDESLLEQLEQRIALVQLGKEFKNGIPLVDRHAALIKNMWVDLLEDDDAVALPWYQRQVQLGHEYAEALRNEDFDSAVNTYIEYVELRDLQIKRWLDLAVRALKGEPNLPEYAQKYADIIFEDPILTEYYNEFGNSLADISFYSDFAKEFIQTAKAKGVAVLPLGPGGPDSTVAVFARTPQALQDFLKENELDQLTDVDIKKIIDGTGTLKGYSPLKIARKGIQFKGFSEVQLTIPSAADSVQYDQMTGTAISASRLAESEGEASADEINLTVRVSKEYATGSELNRDVLTTFTFVNPNGGNNLQSFIAASVFDNPTKLAQDFVDHIVANDPDADFSDTEQYVGLLTLFMGWQGFRRESGARLAVNDSGVDLSVINVTQNPHAHPLIVSKPTGEDRNLDDRSYMGGLFADFLKKWGLIKSGAAPVMLQIGSNFFGTSMLNEYQRQAFQGMTRFADYKDNAEYEQFASDNVILTRQILDGGKGLGVAREGFLSSLGLLEIDENGSPVFGAKATDIKRPIPWRGTVNERGEPTVGRKKVFAGATTVNSDGFLTDSSGKEILASIAELKLLQAIEEANENRYNQLNYLPVVSEDSKPSYHKLLYEGRYLPDVLNGVQNPRVYSQVAVQVGLNVHPESEWLVARDVPVFDVDTQDLIEDKNSGKYTTGGGHGQWGHYNLRDALKSEFPDDGKTRITEIVSGDGLNGSIPRPVIGAMAKEGLAVVMAVTQRTDLDAKGGVVGVELIDGTNLDDPDAIIATQMEELAQAQAVEDSGVVGELEKFQGIGLDGVNGTVGEEAFNTNVAAINKTVVKGILSDLLNILETHYTQQLGNATLGAQKAEERISEIISPNLIEKLVEKEVDGKKVKSHIQLEGAMGLALLSLNRFFEHPNENKDGFSPDQLDSIKNILTSRNLTKIVTPVFFTAEERDEVFTPIKTGFDAWLQMFGGYYDLDIIPGSKNRWRYKTIQRDDKALAMPPQLDMDLKDPHYSEIQSWVETLGRNSDTRELTRIKIELADKDAPIIVGSAILKGAVELVNQSDQPVSIASVSQNLPRAPDGRIILENVRITINAGIQPIGARIAIEAIGSRLAVNDSGVDLSVINVTQNPHAHPLIVSKPTGEDRNLDDRSYMGGLFADFLKKWGLIKSGAAPVMLQIGSNFFGTSMLNEYQRQAFQGMRYFADYKDNPEYEQFASDNVILTRQILDGGKGLGVAREGFLSSLGLLEIDENGSPVFGAKATDIKRPIPWRGTVNERGEPTVGRKKVFAGATTVNSDGFLTDSSGKEILASIAELKLLQAIEEANENRYNQLNYLPVVSEDSKPSYHKLLYEGRYLPDVLNGVQNPRVYSQVAVQVGLNVHPESEWLVARDVPVFDVDTQDLIEDKNSGKYTTGGGHGQWGHYNLRDALKSEFPDDGKTRITEIVSGDGLNGSIPRPVIGAMAKEGLAVVMAVTQRTDLDAKGGVVGVELIDGTNLDDPDAIIATQMEELAQAKAVEASGVVGELEKFQGIGLDGVNGTVGEEAFNTNVAAINKTVVKGILSDLLNILETHYTQQLGNATLGAQKAEERISEIISPNLIEKLVEKEVDGKKVKSHIQLEGAMGLALLSLNRFFEHPNENKDGFSPDQLDSIKNILTSRNLTKIVTPVFFTAEERDEVFTPIKTGFDAWLQMFGGYYDLDIIPGSKNRWRYKTIQRDDKALAMPPQLDMDLKDPHYSEIQSWVETLGRNSDTRELTRIKIELADKDAPIIVGSAILKGEVELVNQSDQPVSIASVSQNLPRAPDGRIILENVRIIIDAGVQPIGSRIAIEVIGSRLADKYYKAPSRWSVAGILGVGNYFQIQSILDFLKQKHGVALTPGDSRQIQNLLRQLPNHELVFKHAIEYVLNYSEDPIQVIERLKLTQKFASQAIQAISELTVGKETKTETEDFNLSGFTTKVRTNETETYPFNLNHIDWSEVYRFASVYVAEGNEIQVVIQPRQTGVSWDEYIGDDPTSGDREVIATPFQPQTFRLAPVASRLAIASDLPENLLLAKEEINTFKLLNKKELNEYGRRVFRTKLQEKVWEVYEEFKLHELTVEQRAIFIEEVFDRDLFLDEYLVLSRTANAYRAGEIEKDDNGRLTPRGYTNLRNRDSRIVNSLSVQANRNIRFAENVLFDITNRERALLEKEYQIAEAEKELSGSGKAVLTQVVEIQDIHGGTVRLVQLIGSSFGLSKQAVAEISNLKQLQAALAQAQIDPSTLPIRFVGFNDLIDRGPDPDGVYEVVQWLDSTRTLKQFPGNHDVYRAFAVLRIHDYLAQAYPKFDPTSKAQANHNFADWIRQAFEHAGWGDVELDQENQQNFNDEVARVNAEIQRLRESDRLTADEKAKLVDLKFIDLVKIRDAEDEELQRIKDHNDRIRRGSADSDELLDLPNVFKKTSDHVKNELAKANQRIAEINGLLGSRKDLRIFPLEFTQYDFSNFHQSRRIVQRALWQLQSFRRLYYVDEYGVLHIHNTLPVNQFGIKINYRSAVGLAALDLYAERITQVFEKMTVEQLMEALERPNFEYAKKISDEIGDVIEAVIDWYSDIAKTAKEASYQDAYFASGIYGQNIQDQWSQNDAIGAEPRFLMTLGHVPEQKVKAPILRVNWLTGTGIALTDHNLSPNYGGKGASFSIGGRDAKGEFKGLRLEGFKNAETNELTDLTLRDLKEIEDPLDAYLLRKLHSGKGFLNWLRFKNLLKNQADLIRLSARAEKEKREDKVLIFEAKLQQVQQRINSLVDEVAEDEVATNKNKIYDLLILGGDYAVAKAKALFNEGTIADDLAGQHEGEVNVLSLVGRYIEKSEDYNKQNVPSLSAARLAEESSEAGNVLDDAVRLVVEIIGTDAEFTVTREQIYTELVVRALDGRPSLTQGILPILWGDNSLTAYTFRLDGNAVIVQIPGNDLRIDDFRGKSRALKGDERKVVSAAATQSIDLAHDQSSTLSEYGRLLKTSLKLPADVQIPLATFSEIKKSEHAEIQAKLLIKNLEWIQKQNWGSDYVFYFDAEEMKLIPKSVRQVIERSAARSGGVFVVGNRPTDSRRLLFKLFASQADSNAFKKSHEADASAVNVNVPLIRGGVVPNWTRYVAEAALFVNEVTATGTPQELAQAQAGEADLTIYMERLNQGLEEAVTSEITLFEYMRGQRRATGKTFLMKPLRVIAIDALIRGLRMAIATIGASA